ncbi:MAG TPA: hypothetical protein VHC18_01355 [Amycolatopsis sp.]|nr:hypothetical protein [Amycolatopsis sp.]
MDRTLPAELTDFHAEGREWLSAHVPERPPAGARFVGIEHAGFSGLRLPEGAGGIGARLAVDADGGHRWLELGPESSILYQSGAVDVVAREPSAAILATPGGRPVPAQRR